MPLEWTGRRKACFYSDSFFSAAQGQRWAYQHPGPLGALGAEEVATAFTIGKDRLICWTLELLLRYQCIDLAP